MLKRDKLLELCRYGLVGISLVITEYAIYVAGVLGHAGSPEFWNIVARLAGGSLGYLLHCSYTFSGSSHSSSKLLRYAGLLVVNTGIATILLAVARSALPAIPAKIFADVTAAVVGYVATRLILVEGSERGGAQGAKP